MKKLVKWFKMKYYNHKLKVLEEKSLCVEEFINHIDAIGGDFTEVVYQRNKILIEISSVRKKIGKQPKGEFSCTKKTKGKL